MFLYLLILIAALGLEGFSSYLSVIGLSQNTNTIIVVLAVLLDIVKVIIATTLYKKFNLIPLFFKFCLIIALFFLMLVTSSGTYGYLIKEFGNSNISQEQITVQITAMEEEKQRIELRKKEIDNQIASLPSNSVNQRKKLTKLFEKELNQINDRIIELDKSIPEANIKKVLNKKNNSNLSNLSASYGLSNDLANKIIAFIITLMLDPLSISLLTISNIIYENNIKLKKSTSNGILFVRNGIIKNKVKLTSKIEIYSFLKKLQGKLIEKVNPVKFISNQHKDKKLIKLKKEFIEEQSILVNIGTENKINTISFISDFKVK